jgi:D-alanyl-D-alanine carboxypeptidase
VFLPLKLVALVWLTLHNSTSTTTPTVPLAPCEHADAGEDLLLLVNKSDSHSLARRWGPRDLVKLPRHLMIRGRKGKLRKEAGAALRSMLAAAQEDGHQIKVRSAYRSFRTQRRVFHSKERKYGSRYARRVSAEPGRSQHQLGTTVDLVAARFKWKFTQRFAQAPEGMWLAEHAHEYGFALSYPEGKEKLTGYIHEPWHYRYLGAEAADEMNRLDISMESYLRRCRSCDAHLECRVSDLD